MNTVSFPRNSSEEEEVEEKEKKKGNTFVLFSLARSLLGSWPKTEERERERECELAERKEETESEWFKLH